RGSRCRAATPPPAGRTAAGGPRSRPPTPRRRRPRSRSAWAGSQPGRAPPATAGRATRWTRAGARTRPSPAAVLQPPPGLAETLSTEDRGRTPRAPSSSRSSHVTVTERSLRLHADATVAPDDLGVHVAVAQQLDRHRGELVGAAQALGEQHVALEAFLELLAAGAGAVDRGV